MPPSYPLPPQVHAPGLRVRLRRGVGQGMARLLAAPAPQPRPTLERVLLLRPDHLGDLLFLGPAARWLRAALPASHITLAVGPWARPALPGLAGCYDDLFEIPFPAFERGPRAGAWARWRLLPFLARQAAQGDFDAAVVLRPDHWWGAMLTALADIPLRIGYATPETTPWLTSALPLPREHAAASNLRLVAALVDQPIAPDPLAHPLRFTLSIEAQHEANAILTASGIDNSRQFVAIHPGAGAEVKRWENTAWGQVAARLHETGRVVLITGGPGEEALTAEVARLAGAGAVDLGGRLRFDVLAAVLAGAHLAIGPDSGPLHLAAAVGVPTLHLFGPADPVLFGPWGPPARHLVLQSEWACIPCQRLDWPDPQAHGCVRAISPERVLAAALQMLERFGNDLTPHPRARTLAL